LSTPISRMFAASSLEPDSISSDLSGVSSKMPESEPLDLFLDTSAHFNRQSLDGEVRRQIEELVGAARITASSTYSRLEFKLSFLQDLAYLHGKLRRLRSIPAVYAELSRLPSPYHDRKLRRTLAHLARFHQDVPGGDAARVDAMLLSIEAAAPALWEWFDESVDYLTDGTGCVRSKEGPRLIRGHLDVTHKACRPTVVRCRIHKFFTENKSSFEKLAAEIDALSDGEKTRELAMIREIVGRAVADSTILCDDRQCRRFGDALIGVDGKGFPSIASSNLREFTIICKALEKTLQPLLPS